MRLIVFFPDSSFKVLLCGNIKIIHIFTVIENSRNLSYLAVQWFGLVYWGLTPQQQQGHIEAVMMMTMTMMKSVFRWRKPEYPEETTDLRQVTDETFHTYGLRPVRAPLQWFGETVLSLPEQTDRTKTIPIIRSAQTEGIK